MIIRIIKNLPLSVEYRFHKKLNKWIKFILNLNNYRNLNYFSLNVTKVKYKELIDPILNTIEPILNDLELEFIYIYYSKSKRLFDISNPCSILDKYICDAIVEKGIIPEDNISIIKKVTYEYGGIDKLNPRVDLVIKKYEPINYF